MGNNTTLRDEIESTINWFAEADKKIYGHVTDLTKKAAEVQKVRLKTFYVMYNVGAVKYLFNFDNGIDTHKDGSPFINIKTFSSKKKLAACIKQFQKEEYTEK